MPAKPLKSVPPRSADARLAEVEVALAREMRVSKALREVGVALGTTLDLDQLLELILDRITKAPEARATLYLLDEVNDELVSRIAQGQDVRSIRLKIGHGIAGYVARTGKPLHIRDAYKDPRFSPEWDMISGYRTEPRFGLLFTEALDRLMVGWDQPLSYRHHREWAAILEDVGFARERFGSLDGLIRTW